MGPRCPDTWAHALGKSASTSQEDTNLEQSRVPSSGQVGPVEATEAWIEGRLTFSQLLWCQSSMQPSDSNCDPSSTDMGLARLHNHMSLFLILNLSLSLSHSLSVSLSLPLSHRQMIAHLPQNSAPKNFFAWGEVLQ